ncbi:hypothetical protein [Streptomyces sp. NPDC048266]|uniref:hypothetical protein n=1 Tax=Streptomyces sp. NPDC048266 TaxID=3155787 RepID=UPI0033F3D67B
MRSALPEVSPAAERDQQAATEGAVVQRVIGQNSSTAGVDHAQGEHVFNDVATLVNEFREAARAQGGALIIWVNGDGKVHSKAKRRRVVAKLTAANTQLASLSVEVATALDTHRRHHQYGTVNSGLGDDNNAGVFGLYKRDILALCVTAARTGSSWRTRPREVSPNWRAHATTASSTWSHSGT